MKTKTAKTKISPAEIDRIGEEYENLNETAKTATKQLEESKSAIKRLAENEPLVENRRVLEGHKFDIGLTEVNNYLLSVEAAKTLLPPKLQKQLIVTTESIDRKAFESLVDEGVISKQIASKILLVSPIPTKKIYVKRKN
jgi:hypothetical protein